MTGKPLGGFIKVELAERVFHHDEDEALHEAPVIRSFLRRGKRPASRY